MVAKYLYLVPDLDPELSEEEFEYLQGVFSNLEDNSLVVFNELVLNSSLGSIRIAKLFNQLNTQKNRYFILPYLSGSLRALHCAISGEVMPEYEYVKSAPNTKKSILIGNHDELHFPVVTNDRRLKDMNGAIYYVKKGGNNLDKNIISSKNSVGSLRYSSKIDCNASKGIVKINLSDFSSQTIDYISKTKMYLFNYDGEKYIDINGNEISYDDLVELSNQDNVKVYIDDYSQVDIDKNEEIEVDFNASMDEMLKSKLSPEAYGLLIKLLKEVSV